MEIVHSSEYMSFGTFEMHLNKDLKKNERGGGRFFDLLQKRNGFLLPDF